MISNTKVLAILQARMNANRPPGKVLMDLNGAPMLQRQLARISNSEKISKVIVATSNTSDDIPILSLCEKLGVESYGGPLENVLQRFIEVLDRNPCEVIIRLTGDCPLFMPELCDRMISEFLKSSFDYYSNTIIPSFPDGLDIEIFRAEALRKVASQIVSMDEFEHVTLGIYRRPELFSCGNYSSDQNLGELRWTVDTEIDLNFIRKIYANFEGRESKFDLQEVLDFLAINPQLSNIDPGNLRNSALNQKLGK